MDNPLKRKRRDMKLTIEDVAEASGLNARTIQCYESAYRNPPAKDILTVAKAYNLTEDEIIEWLKYIEYKSYKKKE